MPSKIKPLQQLSPQHLLFCRMYIGEAVFNGTRAAELAGYKPSGCRSQAYALLKDPLIQAELSKLAKPALEAAELSIDSVLAELAAITHLSIADYFNSEGGIIPLAELSEPSKKAIKSMRVRIAADGSGDQIVDLQFHDKMKAINLAMQKLGLLSDAMHENSDKAKIVMMSLEQYADEGLLLQEGDIPMIELAGFEDVAYEAEKAEERDKVDHPEKPNPYQPEEPPPRPRKRLPVR